MHERGQRQDGRLVPVVAPSLNAIAMALVLPGLDGALRWVAGLIPATSVIMALLGLQAQRSRK